MFIEATLHLREGASQEDLFGVKTAIDTIGGNKNDTPDRLIRNPILLRSFPQRLLALDNAAYHVRPFGCGNFPRWRVWTRVALREGNHSWIIRCLVKWIIRLDIFRTGFRHIDKNVTTISEHLLGVKARCDWWFVFL